MARNCHPCQVARSRRAAGNVLLIRTINFTGLYCACSKILTQVKDCEVRGELFARITISFPKLRQNHSKVIVPVRGDDAMHPVSS